MVVSAEFDVGLHDDGVVALGQRVEQLVDRDRLVFLEAVPEILPLHHPRQRVGAGEAHQALGAQGSEPLAVVLDLGAFPVEDLPGLFLVGPGVGQDLVA